MKCAVVWSNDQDARNTGIAGIATLAFTSLCRPGSWIQSLIAVYPDILVFLYFYTGSSWPLYLDFAILPSNGYTRAISGNLSVCRATPQGRRPAWLQFTTTIISSHPKATDDSFSKNRPLRIVFGTVRSIRGVSARSIHTLNLKRDVNGRRTHCLPRIDVRLSDKGSINLSSRKYTRELRPGEGHQEHQLHSVNLLAPSIPNSEVSLIKQVTDLGMDSG